MPNPKDARVTRETVYRDIIPRMADDPSLTAARVAQLLDLSPRQVFRLKAKVKLAGVDGLAHGNRGRPSAHAKPDRLHQHVLQLYEEDYAEAGYNYAHFTDALANDHGITLSPATIRRWLLDAGQGQKPRRYCHHRRHRLRSASLGYMLFLDGSPHRWFGPKQPRSTLILASDDATGAPLYGHFEPQESLNGCFEVFYHVAQRYGLPVCLYLDRAGQFTTTRHGGVHRRQRDDLPTAFEIAMKRLAVELIFADSPQARGRGERLNRSFQNRLVAECIHHGIQDQPAADRYLNESFIPRYRRQFAVEPRCPKSAFRPLPEGLDLHTVLCRVVTRNVVSDNTIALHGFRYQLHPPASTRTLCFSTVTVQEWFDGSVHVLHPHHGEIPNECIPSNDILRLRYQTQKRWV